MMEIKVQDLSKAYRTQLALDHVSCTFASGQIHGIVGRNGSGKSVLLRCLCGYTRPTSGTIVMDGKQLGKDMPFPPGMGLLLDSPGFLPRLNGYDNLALLMSVRSRGRAQNKLLIQEALAQVGLTDQQHKKVSQYSLGMRQRLGIAQALMEQPTLLILDEPFNGLDREGVKQIRTLLGQLRDGGATMLLTSHYPEDLAALCDTITHLDGGKIIAHDTQDKPAGKEALL